jgi:hypothetical protein
VNRDELELTAALTDVNSKITKLIFRVMDEAGGQGLTEYTVPIAEVEYRVGTKMVELGRTLQERAAADGFVVLESGSPPTSSP